MFRRKQENAPFDKRDLVGPVAHEVALLGYFSGLSREQAENVWEVIAYQPYDADIIAAFFLAADGLGYTYKRTVGW